MRTLIGHSTIKKSDVVYDIGAGSGIITSALAQACAQVVAIEIDERMVVKLKENTSDLKNVTVLPGNVLDMKLPDHAYKVFANIPFHLSSPILRKLTEASHPPTAIYLIVQKQFAKKLLVGGAASFTGLLGAMITPWFSTRIRYTLQKTDYWPHPAVDTVMIELLRRDAPLLPDIERADYISFVEHCYSRQKYFMALPATLTYGKRPSQLTSEQWVALYESVSKA